MVDENSNATDRTERGAPTGPDGSFLVSPLPGRSGRARAGAVPTLRHFRTHRIWMDSSIELGCKFGDDVD